MRPLYIVHVYRQETDFFKGLSCVLLTVLGVLSSTERSWKVPRERSKRCVFGSCCPRAGKAFCLLETNILAVHSREREKERGERSWSPALIRAHPILGQDLRFIGEARCLVYHQHQSADLRQVWGLLLLVVSEDDFM